VFSQNFFRDIANGKRIIKLNFIVLTLLVITGNESILADTAEIKCVNPRQIDKAMRGPIKKSDNYQNIRKIVANNALEEAINELNGVIVHSRTRYKLSEKTDNEKTDTKEEYLQVNFGKTQGFIKNYKVISEKIVQQGSWEFLELVLNINVCERDPNNIRIIFAVAEFKDNKGVVIPNVRNSIISRLPTDNPFSVSYELPDEVLADYIIEGELATFEDKEVVASRHEVRETGNSNNNQSGLAVLIDSFAALAASESKNKEGAAALIGEFLVTAEASGDSRRSTPNNLNINEDKVRHIVMTIILNAHNSAEHSVVSKTATIKASFSGDENQGLQLSNLLVRNLFNKALGKMIDKIVESIKSKHKKTFSRSASSSSKKHSSPLAP